MSTNLITPLTFNGQSKYSADFQQIVNRAVQSQSIPLSQANDEKAQTQDRLSTLQTIDQPLKSLQTAINKLALSVGDNALAAGVLNPSVASVSIASNATAGTYQLEIDSLGSVTQTVSTNDLQTVSDPSSQSLSNSSSFTLTVNGTATTITPQANTLTSLVSTINAQPSLGVTASIVNVGSSGTPDYRVSLQSSKLGNVSIQLGDGSTNTDGSARNLLQTISTGASATYKVDGLAQTISSDSDTITLAPGVTVNLLQTTASGSPTTVVVAQQTNNAATALAQFATAYNNAVDALATQHGKSSGSLAGDSAIQLAQQAMSAINGYNTTGGSVQYLSELGLDLDAKGHLTFTAAEFQNGVGNNFSGLSNFLGSATSGFVQAATNALTNLEEPSYGAFKTEETSLQKSLSSLNAKIASTTAQINLFQQNLVNQLSASDATISVLQSQYTFFQGLYSYNTNSNG